MGSNKAPTFFIWKEEILISIIFAMVRMFHDENKYFITESSDYERVLNYGRNGIENSSGWHIHLEVRPLHKVESGGYNGSGDELIHLFYNGDGRYAVGDPSDQSSLTGELIPGTTYVSYQCIYMNPLSSYGASSDSGYRYIIGDDHFTMINRGSGAVSFIASSLDNKTDYADEYEHTIISKPDWKWQEFPYTDEEWNELHKPGITSFGIYNPNQMFAEILYQPITDNLFLLRVDGTLWLVELKDNPQMGTYLWSIYSLVPESAMGVRNGNMRPCSAHGCRYFALSSIWNTPKYPPPAKTVFSPIGMHREVRSMNIV